MKPRREFIQKTVLGVSGLACLPFSLYALKENESEPWGQYKDYIIMCSVRGWGYSQQQPLVNHYNDPRIIHTVWSGDDYSYCYDRFEQLINSLVRSTELLGENNPDIKNYTIVIKTSDDQKDPIIQENLNEWTEKYNNQLNKNYTRPN